MWPDALVAWSVSKDSLLFLIHPLVEGVHGMQIGKITLASLFHLVVQLL